MTNPGWGVVLRGEPADLEGWANNFKEPFNQYPRVEKHDGDTVLRSDSFDNLTSAQEVRERAVPLIERLNCALALLQRSEPVQFGAVIQFKSDGTQHRTAFLEPATLVGSGGFFGSAIIMGPDGNPRPEPPPQPSEAQRWLAIIENDKLLDDALRYFRKGADWASIYNALECLIEKAGGEVAFLRLNWASELEIKRLKYTAAWERKKAQHANPKDKPPKHPMDVNDAYALLDRLLRRALNYWGPTPP
jgi:hypothetical protein